MITMILIFSSDDVQDGGADDDPFEGLGLRPLELVTEGAYYLVITKEYCHDEPAWIQLTTWMADDLQHYSAGHHITNPAEGRNPGMLAVAATHWWDTEYIASYSSRGPALDGRIKPDITGVACADVQQHMAPSAPALRAPLAEPARLLPTWLAWQPW